MAVASGAAQADAVLSPALVVAVDLSPTATARLANP
jgi:hypothetical protein